MLESRLPLFRQRMTIAVLKVQWLRLVFDSWACDHASWAQPARFQLQPVAVPRRPQKVLPKVKRMVVRSYWTEIEKRCWHPTDPTTPGSCPSPADRLPKSSHCRNASLWQSCRWRMGRATGLSDRDWRRTNLTKADSSCARFGTRW